MLTQETTETIGAVFDAMDFSPNVNRAWVVDGVQRLIAVHDTYAQALHDVRLSIQSLGSYTSRDLKACARVLLHYVDRQAEAQ
jgi:hypothetical protein